MGRSAGNKWGFQKNEELRIAFRYLIDVPDTVYSFPGNGEICQVYYAGDVLYRIDIVKRQSCLKLTFNMGHFRFWNDYEGIPHRNKDRTLSPEFEKKWDENWQGISNSLQPTLDSALKVCASFVSIKLNVLEYAKKEKQRYLAKSKNQTDWNLKSEIRTAQEADLFISEFVPLLKKAIEQFQDNMNRIERMEAQRLQNFCSAEAYAKGKTPLFFAECEYKLNSNVSNRLLIECCDNFTCNENIFKRKNKKGEETTVSIGKPDGIGLLRYNGNECPCVIEIKYETDALIGGSGICRHLRDMCAIAQDAITMSVIRDDLLFGLTDKLDLKYDSASIEKCAKNYTVDSLNSEPLLLFIMFTDSDAESIRTAVEQELNAQRACLTGKHPEILFAIQSNTQTNVDPRLVISSYHFYRLTSDGGNSTLVLNETVLNNYM